MNLSSIKADKWKIISLVIIGIFALTILMGYLQQNENHGLSLSDEEKEMAINLAVEAMEGRITEDFSPQVRDSGFRIIDRSGNNYTMAFVTFTSEKEDLNYQVVVDLNEGKIMQIIENRVPMRGRGQPGNGPPTGGRPRFMKF